MLFHTDETDVKRAMIRASKEVICLADYSKFHKTALVSFAQLEELNYIVTNDAIPPEDQQFLSSKGVQVIIA